MDVGGMRRMQLILPAATDEDHMARPEGQKHGESPAQQQSFHPN